MSPAYGGAVVVVTGAASGIGRAAGHRLAALGARVIGLDRHAGAARGVEARIADVTDPLSVAAALTDLPVVDALFNCAGVTGAAGPETTLAVNVLGTREVSRQVLDRMPDDGSITNVASVGAWNWDRGFDLAREFVVGVGHGSLAAWCEAHADVLTPSSYPFSKQCVVVETLLRAAELVPRRIRVNAVCPGLVDTPMLDVPAGAGPRFVPGFPLPFGRMTTADEQAAVLAYLGGPDAGALSGAIVPTDHGLLASVRVGAIPSPFGDA